MKIIKKFVKTYGCGGVTNYTAEQRADLYNLLNNLFSGNYAVVEMASIRDLLVSLDLDRTSEKMVQCIDEVEKANQ
jgi:hypothetical protein